MSINNLFNCRKFSLLLYFLLILQVSKGQNKFPKTNEWLKDNVEELGGKAILVLFKDGKIIFTGSENNLTNRQKMMARVIARRQGKDAAEITRDYNMNTRERIASSSKWLSAALVMTFVDEGKLSLYDSVGKYLPVMTASGKGGIKIWQCLSHLTGIKSASLRESLEEMKNIKSMDEAIEKISLLPMEGEPGKTFHYSNTGLQIAGAVIEKISGKNFETLFAEKIAHPCGMKNTDFGKGNVALPAGGAFSTPTDYMNFLMMILNDGMLNGKKVLSKESIIAMQKNYANDAKIIYSPAEAGTWGYGFGEWVMEENGRPKGVTSPGLFGSFPWIDNTKKYAGFLFCFNLKSKGRNDRYTELTRVVGEEVSK